MQFIQSNSNSPPPPLSGVLVLVVMSVPPAVIDLFTALCATASSGTPTTAPGSTLCRVANPPNPLRRSRDGNSLASSGGVSGVSGVDGAVPVIRKSALRDLLVDSDLLSDAGIEPTKRDEFLSLFTGGDESLIGVEEFASVLGTFLIRHSPNTAVDSLSAPGQASGQTSGHNKSQARIFTFNVTGSNEQTGDDTPNYGPTTADTEGRGPAQPAVAISAGGEFDSAELSGAEGERRVVVMPELVLPPSVLSVRKRHIVAAAHASAPAVAPPPAVNISESDESIAAGDYQPVSNAEITEMEVAKAESQTRKQMRRKFARTSNLYKDHISDLEQTITEYERLAVVAAGEKAELMRCRNALRSREAEIAEFQTQLLRLQSENDEYAKRVNRLTQGNERLTAQITTVQSAYDTLSLQHAQCNDKTRSFFSTPRKLSPPPPPRAAVPVPVTPVFTPPPPKIVSPAVEAISIASNPLTEKYFPRTVAVLRSLVTVNSELSAQITAHRIESPIADSDGSGSGAADHSDCERLISELQSSVRALRAQCDMNELRSSAAVSPLSVMSQTGPAVATGSGQDSAWCFTCSCSTDVAALKRMIAERDFAIRQFVDYHLQPSTNDQAGRITQSTIDYARRFVTTTGTTSFAAATSGGAVPTATAIGTTNGGFDIPTPVHDIKHSATAIVLSGKPTVPTAAAAVIQSGACASNVNSNATTTTTTVTILKSPQPNAIQLTVNTEIVKSKVRSKSKALLIPPSQSKPVSSVTLSVLPSDSSNNQFSRNKQ